MRLVEVCSAQGRCEVWIAHYARHEAFAYHEHGGHPLDGRSGSADCHSAPCSTTTVSASLENVRWGSRRMFARSTHSRRICAPCPLPLGPPTSMSGCESRDEAFYVAGVQGLVPGGDGLYLRAYTFGRWRGAHPPPVADVVGLVLQGELVRGAGDRVVPVEAGAAEAVFRLAAWRRPSRRSRGRRGWWPRSGPGSPPPSGSRRRAGLGLSMSMP